MEILLLYFLEILQSPIYVIFISIILMRCEGDIARFFAIIRIHNEYINYQIIIINVLDII